jgi:prepilin-type N-terminal cleavage/methylation domain-containing protein
MRKGFTLIELMIVVVIIGILAALAIPRFMQASVKAKAREGNLVLKQIWTAASSYYEENGVFPGATDAGGLFADLSQGNWNEAPLDIPSGEPRFVYHVRTGGADGFFASALPNNAVDKSLASKLDSIWIDINGVLDEAWQ